MGTHFGRELPKTSILGWAEGPAPRRQVPVAATKPDPTGHLTPLISHLQASRPWRSKLCGGPSRCPPVQLGYPWPGMTEYARLGARDRRQLSPVIRALRLTGEEVQFGRVLAALCQDSTVAAAFTAAVIKRARGGNAATRRKLKAPTSGIRCVDEQRLRASRRSLRQRAKDLGRVDLEFSGADNWRLVVEIKLGAGFGEHQIERYMSERPVAVIVRDTSDLPPRGNRSGWVGAATWESLREDLRDLPVDPSWRPEWLGLLSVMDRDGDFAPNTPDGLPEVIAARDQLADAAPVVLARFCAELERTYGPESKAAVGRLRHSRPSGKRGPWAGFSISTPTDGHWLSIDIRNIWSPAPRLRICQWYPDIRRAKSQIQDAHSRLANKDGFRQLEEGAAFEVPNPDLAGASTATLATAIGDRLTLLLHAGAFDPDVRYQHKHYSPLHR
jgi:hypothetical protein